MLKGIPIAEEWEKMNGGFEERQKIYFYEYMLVIETNDRKFNMFVKRTTPLKDGKEVQNLIRDLETMFKSNVVILNWILLNTERVD
jgi:hypothetical protein